jgi:hypothetical protein
LGAIAVQPTMTPVKVRRHGALISVLDIYVLKARLNEHYPYTTPYTSQEHG